MNSESGRSEPRSLPAPSKLAWQAWQDWPCLRSSGAEQRAYHPPILLATKEYRQSVGLLIICLVLSHSFGHGHLCALTIRHLHRKITATLCCSVHARLVGIETVMPFVALPPLGTRVGSDSYICGPQPRPSNRSSCQHQAPGFVADMHLCCRQRLLHLCYLGPLARNILPLAP